MGLFGSNCGLLAAGALAFAVLATAITVPARSQSEQAGPRFGEPFPAISLPGSAGKSASQGPVNFGGKQAVQVLGSKLGAVAGWYGIPEETLRTQLLQDPTLKVDRTGRLYFVESAEASASTPRPGTNSGKRSATDRLLPRSLGNPLWDPVAAINDGQLAPLHQTFTLHSKPGASKTIYLNFVGADLKNNAWNAAYYNSFIRAPGFSLDLKKFYFDANRNWKDPAVIKSLFSDEELTAIQKIWQVVAEDYAIFDVDVTTEPPPPDRLWRNGDGDPFVGIEILFTDNRNVFNDRSAFGVGYFWQIGEAYWNPGLVFVDEKLAYGQGTPTGLANTASHEAGHYLGLFHDGYWNGNIFEAYYAGHYGWSPIMGPSGPLPFKQFSKGEYPNAANQSPWLSPLVEKQDDLAVIQGYLGLRPDEVGDTIRAAAPLTFNSTSGSTTATARGVITGASDSDVYSLTVADAGWLAASVAPPAMRPNPDLELTLMGAAGEVLSTDNPRDSSSASANYQITKPGTYYLRVKGAGLAALNGNPGYSTYGSVGHYTLTAALRKGKSPPTAVITVTPAPDTDSMIFVGEAPLTLSFDAWRSSDDTAVKFVYWKFVKRESGSVDSEDKTGTLWVANKVFRDPGEYDVELTVADEDGLTSTATAYVMVVPSGTLSVLPSVSITATPETGPAPLTVKLQASASNTGAHCCVLYWSFDGVRDPQFNSSSSPGRASRTYKVPGTYTVEVAAVDALGRTKKVTKTITVTGSAPPNSDPVARLRLSPASGTAPLAVTLDGSGSSDEQGVTGYSWTINGKTEASLANTPKPSYTFSAPGIYTVVLTVRDAQGRTNSALGVVTVNPAPQQNKAPSARLTVSAVTGNAPLRVTLDGSASSDDVRVMSYDWTINGRAEASLANIAKPEYRFSEPGTYRVELTVKDAQGLSDKAAAVITVTAPPPPPPPPPPVSGALTAQVSLKALPLGNGRFAATGTLLVKDGAGKGVSGAQVAYRWEELATGTRAVISQARGNLILSTASGKKGCFRLTITGITLKGYSYTPASPDKAQACN